MPTQVIEIDRSKIGLIPGTDKQVGGDILRLFTKVPAGGQGEWSARVECDQEYPSCPVKGGSTGIICNAINTDRKAWERDIMSPISGSVCCGKAPSIKSSIDEANHNITNSPPVESIYA